MSTSIVAGVDATPVLEPAKHVLDPVALAAGLPPSSALNVATAQLQRLKTSEAMALLDGIDHPDTRKAAKSRIESAPEECAFSRAYVFGGMSIYGLM